MNNYSVIVCFPWSADPFKPQESSTWLPFTYLQTCGHAFPFWIGCLSFRPVSLENLFRLEKPRKLGSGLCFFRFFVFQHFFWMHQLHLSLLPPQEYFFLLVSQFVCGIEGSIFRLALSSPHEFEAHNRLRLFYTHGLSLYALTTMLQSRSFFSHLAQVCELYTEGKGPQLWLPPYLLTKEVYPSH